MLILLFLFSSCISSQVNSETSPLDDSTPQSASAKKAPIPNSSLNSMSSTTAFNSGPNLSPANAESDLNTSNMEMTNSAPIQNSVPIENASQNSQLQNPNLVNNSESLENEENLSGNITNGNEINTALDNNSTNELNTPVSTPKKVSIKQNATPDLNTVLDQKTLTEYEVKKGNTLWDISKRYLNNPRSWRKIWTKNKPKIPNPHKIYPHQKIIVESSDSISGDASSLTLSDSQKIASGSSLNPEAIKEFDPHSIATVVRGEEIGVFKPIRLQHNDIIELFKPLPVNPEWLDKDGEIIPTHEVTESDDFIVFENFIPETQMLLKNPGFLTKNPPFTVGEISSSPSTSLLGQWGNTQSNSVFATFDYRLNLKPGQLFHTIRKNELSSTLFYEPEQSGEFWSYTGTVGVLKVGPELVELYTESSPMGISAGDKIIPYKNIYKTINLDKIEDTFTFQSRVEAIAEGIGYLGGKNQFIYLWKNASSIQANDEFDLYMPPSGIMGFGDVATHGLKQVARAKVIDMNDESITAIIIKSLQEVSLGAYAWPGK
jgi:hypothetical protein